MVTRNRRETTTLLRVKETRNENSTRFTPNFCYRWGTHRFSFVTYDLPSNPLPSSEQHDQSVTVLSRYGRG